MHKIFYRFLPLFLLVLASSCQRVIDVHLNSSRSKYVIEGVVTDQPGSWSVSITQTKDFSADNTFSGVSGATVTIGNNGTIFPLAESRPGVYSTASLTGVPGNTYNLRVVLDGVVYTSSSTMPQPVSLDSIYITTDQRTNKKFIIAVYTDPRGIPNYYRGVQYVNGRKEPTIFLSNDEFTDGLNIVATLNFTNDNNDTTRDIKTGDSIRADLLCIDSSVYAYWSSLKNDASGNGNTASPANPVSNITGGCLGYFSAQTVRAKSLLVPK
jgi:hypothetical protein